MYKICLDFFNEESGQGMVEYGLIITLIAIGVLLAVQGFGLSVQDLFEYITGKI